MGARTRIILVTIFCLSSLFFVACRETEDKEFDEFGDPKTPGSEASIFGVANVGGDIGPAKIPNQAQACNGVYISYNLMSREKTYPYVKNVTAQSWAFKAQVQLVNMGTLELKSWKVYIGFRYRELLVEAEGATLVDGDELPALIGINGTTIAGWPQTDLKTAIDTAGDYNQISAQIILKGTQFGLKPPATPMPKTIRLANEGFKCPAPTKHKSNMFVCCRKDPKFKPKSTNMFTKQENGDLNIVYDILQAYTNKYQAQVTIENNHPLGRLDHWNVSWDWMRGEFIYSLRGAYTHLKDPSKCIYGEQGQYYQDFDFTQVANCERRPVISDLPREMKDNDKIGKLPFCCKNGTLLPKTMNVSESKSIFQMEVFKIAPDMNRTAIYPPQNWRVTGILNPIYKCTDPIRAEPSASPDPTGLQAEVMTVASWQIVCNITKPKERQSRCCVSFSAFFNDSVVPCDTCSCGCDNLPEETRCNSKAHAMLLPAEALLVPYANRTKKAEAWATIKHYPIWDPLPCPDNCRVSLNWHIDGDYKNEWTARLTIFNWGDTQFEDWFAAIKMGKASRGFERVYSFNGTMLKDLDYIIFMQGLKGLNYLLPETNGSTPWAPRVPGKQQSVISFAKRLSWKLDIPGGDGFPEKVFFNGEECALPKDRPRPSGGKKSCTVDILMALIFTFFLVMYLIADLMH